MFFRTLDIGCRRKLWTGRETVTFEMRSCVLNVLIPWHFVGARETTGKASLQHRQKPLNTFPPSDPPPHHHHPSSNRFGRCWGGGGFGYCWGDGGSGTPICHHQHRHQHQHHQKQSVVCGKNGGRRHPCSSNQKLFFGGLEERLNAQLM